MADKQLSVTNLADLEAYAGGSIVELPPFSINQPFVARLKRPSMLALVKSGKIPNELMQRAQDLFEGGGGKAFAGKDGVPMNEIFRILEVMCEATFVEPTYQQIKDAGLELTDDQLMFIFNYSQQGVKALESFRK